MRISPAIYYSEKAMQTYPVKALPGAPMLRLLIKVDSLKKPAHYQRKKFKILSTISSGYWDRVNYLSKFRILPRRGSKNDDGSELPILFSLWAIPSALCPLRHAPCPMLYALCPMRPALCSILPPSHFRLPPSALPLPNSYYSITRMVFHLPWEKRQKVTAASWIRKKTVQPQA